MVTLKKVTFIFEPIIIEYSLEVIFMKTKRLIMSALVLLALGITACNNQPVPSDDSSSTPSQSSNDGGSDSSGQAQGHVHTFGAAWRTNDTHHWHVCTGTLENGQACTERSGYAEHDWSEISIVTPPGPTTPGQKKISCSVCKRVKFETIDPTGDQPVVQGNFTFNETDLNRPQNIHSTNQTNYLNYNGDYYNISGSTLSGYGANGNANNSTPEAVSLTWDYTAPTGKSVSSYYVVYGQESDLSDGLQTKTTNTKSISFQNAYLGDNYFKVFAILSDGSIESSQTKIFKVLEQAPRNLKVGNMPNCRDMGGRTTYAGGKIRQGLIYRTAGNKFDNNSDVDADCRDVLLNQLKIKTEFNVGDDKKYTVNLGSSVTTIECFMDYGRANSSEGIGGNGVPYSNMSRNAERVRMVFDTLKDRNSYPLFYHCRIGTDRTGIIAVLLNGLLGVPFQEVIQDYCFSNFAPISGQRYPNIHKNSTDGNGDDPAKYIDEILAMPGKNFQEQTYNALLSIGIPEATLTSIIDILTVGNKATLPNTQKIGKGTGLTSSASRKTASDYKNPDVYYPISSNGTVSYSTTTTAGEKNIVVYIGSTTVSNNTKLASVLSLKIDGNEQTIVDKTLYKAGFGTTAQTSRTAYMFQILGKYNLSAGSHTFVLTAKSSTTINVATICVFDYVTASNQ